MNNFELKALKVFQIALFSPNTAKLMKKNNNRENKWL